MCYVTVKSDVEDLLGYMFWEIRILPYFDSLQLISMNNEKMFGQIDADTQKIQTKGCGTMILWEANYTYPLSHRLEALIYTINFQEIPYHTI